MKSKLFILSLMVSMLAGCGHGNHNLQNGDLVFVGLPAGQKVDTASMDAAISAATGTEGELNITHVGIVEVDKDDIWIIDATPKRGVERHSLQSFLEDNALDDGTPPVYVVKRVKRFDADAAVARANAFCGRSYDFCFLPENDELYCSELIQKCYLRRNDEPLFESEPMNFLATDGTMPPYWEELFKAMGMDVPQGVPGTNPQRLSESKHFAVIPVSLLQIASDQLIPVRKAIERQLQQYPQTRVQDIYKSFCQDNLGPGHLIPNPDAAREYLESELAAYQADLDSARYERPAERYVPVGDAGNYVRVDLSVVLDSLVDASTLLDAFVRSANEGKTLSTDEWKEKWADVASVIRKDFPTIPDAASDLASIDSLMSEGHYILHHSRIFNETYNPHYRIVAKEIFDKELEPLL